MLRALLATVVLLGWAVPPAHAQTVTVTQAPVCGAGPIGSANDLNLNGTVTGLADPSQYKVAAYVFTDQWWTKPTFANPTAPVTATGTFSIDVTTHANDLQAGYFAVFVIPNAVTPPQANGLAALPASLFAYPYATLARECDGRVIAFAGRHWKVKDSGNSLWGPGPNRFSDNPLNVWVDGAGDLHLRITKRMGQWQCAEVTDITANPATSTPGFGTYTFQVATRLDQLDANVVLGLFTWDDDPNSAAVAHREVDFEAAKWGNPNDPTNAQFVVQPWDVPDHLVRYTIPPGDNPTTHRFDWRADHVEWASWLGNSLVPATAGDVIHTYRYDGSDVPPAGGTEHLHLHLRLVYGNAPQNGQEVEVVIRDVTFGAGAVSGVPGNGTRDVRPILSARPNPASGDVTFHLAAPLEGAANALILDARGRVVRSSLVIPAGALEFGWDGRTSSGAPAPPGVYFAVIGDGTARRTGRVVVR
jgi:hypothetical protein